MEWWMLIPDIKNFKLPIIPGEYSFNEPSTIKTVNLLNFGEYILNGMPKAREFSFSCFFPAQEYSFCLCAPYDIWDYVNWIKSAKKENIVCRFVITNTDIDFPCIIDEFSYSQKLDGDLYYKIKLKEYRS